MQLVKTERDTLLRPLQTVSGIVERRHTLPILANLLITKNGPDVSFLSTDLELQITTRADFGVGGDQIATTVAARKLLDILRAMPDGQVTLSLADKRLTVQSGKSRFGYRRWRPTSSRPSRRRRISAPRSPSRRSRSASCSAWCTSRWRSRTSATT